MTSALSESISVPKQFRACITSTELYDDTFSFSYDGDEISMGSKVLTIGDPHFRRENLHSISQYTHRIVTIIERDQPDFVIILGDLLHCHERLHTAVLNKAYTFIHTLRQLVPVYILVGNHDYINNSQFLSTQHWMNAMKEWDDVYIVDTGMVRHSPAGKFIFCPYVFPGRFEEALDIIDPEWHDARAIFCHQEFRGCKMGAIESTVGDIWIESNPFVVSGHIHDKQRIQSNIFYTGSSMQHAYGESPDKTVSMCRFEKQISIENVDLEMPSKRILYMDMDTIQTFIPPKNSEDQLRITVSGTFDDFKVFKKSSKYRELQRQGVRVVYRHKPNVMSSSNTSETIINENFYEILSGMLESEPESVRQAYEQVFAMS